MRDTIKQHRPALFMVACSEEHAKQHDADEEKG
jgi:hypothetical protein